MNKTQHLSELWLLPWSELKIYHDVVADLVSLRARVESPTTPEPLAPPPPPVSSEPRGLQERSPMRSPMPGSVRGDVHEILRSAGNPRGGRESDAPLVRRGAT
jgi:hypothetical protein